MSRTPTALVRTLRLPDAMALVVGSVIGTGVFIKTASVAQNLPSTAWILGVWIAGGALSLCGALTYAELCSRIPAAGGEYAFLKEGYGDVAAFLYGWTRFWIASPGSIAAYASGAATFAFGGSKMSALGLILIFLLVNCLQVRTAGGFQRALTGLKVILVYGLTAGLILLSGTSGVGESFVLTASGGPYGGLRAAGLGAAMIAVLWAYDGWNNASMLAEEVEHPNRNLPIALIGGMALVAVTYTLANYAYCTVLSWEEIVTSSSSAFPHAVPVATKAAQSVIGDRASLWLSVAFAASAIGGMHGSIMASSRVPFAMARDGMFFKRLAFVHQKTHVPVWAVLSQGLVATVLVVTGTFDQLTDYVIFASWVFYALVASLVLRGTDRVEGVFRVPRPIPVLFVVVSLALLANSVWMAPAQSAIGLGLILLGVPFYFYFRHRSRGS